MKKRLERLVKLSRMTAGVAGDYIGWRVKDSLFQNISSSELLKKTHERVGERLAATLGDLKGPLMKIGQMASISSGLLPLEISESLQVLRKNATFVDYDVIARQIERELGEPPERLFTSFSRAPFAAASIGQVHRAVTDDGREVVVKVQYPGIDESVDADLAHLRLALKAAGVMHGKKEVFRRFFADISGQLKEELDYCNEADNLRYLASFHNAHHPFVRIPEVVGERSSARVLTLTCEEGDTLEDAAKYPIETKNLLGERLVTLLYGEIILLGALHGDPNPANLAFRPDGTIVLYDFGCVKRYTAEEHHRLIDIVRAVFDRDFAKIESALQDLGVRASEGPVIEPEMYGTLLEMFSPILSSEVPFDFDKGGLRRNLRTLLPAMKKYGKSFNITQSMMIVQRVNVGTYGNLRKLGPKIAVRPVVERILAKA